MGILLPPFYFHLGLSFVPVKGFKLFNNNCSESIFKTSCAYVSCHSLDSGTKMVTDLGAGALV